MRTSLLARLAASLGVLAALFFVLPPLLIQLGLLEPFRGFRLFLLSAPLGLLALATGTTALFVTRAGTGRGGRGQALFASLAGGLIVAMIAVAALPSLRVPPINDVTTDPEDPPAFSAAAELAANRERDMSHPGEKVAAQQRAGYPGLGPIVLQRPYEQAFGDVLRAVDALDWRLVRRDDDAGVIEAVATSRIFRFEDDVVVRLRRADGGTRVDVRSKSRVGRSDLGANAARIQRLAEALEAGAQGTR